MSDAIRDALVDQMTTAEIHDLIRNGGYQILADANTGKPRAIDFDGPSGLNEGGVTHEPYSITYPCAANLAASWDRQNSYLHGCYVGEDALACNGNWGNHQYTGVISGWYAPAMKIHRTPFAGRNFEYYSEDGFMSGEMAREASAACSEKGVYAYIKHFALNDQEDYRNGLVTFSNEQAIREIYLKPFQTCIEGCGTTTIKTQTYDEASKSFAEAEAEIPAVMAVMSSFNRIGCTWAGGNYSLLTAVLRDEWGSDGTVITGYDIGGYMDTEQCVRAGGGPHRVGRAGHCAALEEGESRKLNVSAAHKTERREPAILCIPIQQQPDPERGPAVVIWQWTPFLVCSGVGCRRYPAGRDGEPPASMRRLDLKGYLRYTGGAGPV